MGLFDEIASLFDSSATPAPAAVVVPVQAPLAVEAVAPQPVPTVEFGGPGTLLAPIDYQEAAARLGLPVAIIHAVSDVETSGSPFLADGTGRSRILFEAHAFDGATGGRHRGAVDRHGVSLSSATWDRSLYGASGEHQYARLEDAIALDREAALASTSWGAFQIMGSNHRICGYDTVEGFVAAMCAGERAHLDAFCAFIRSAGLVRRLQDHDWAGFAEHYNGPGYAQNHYDSKLAEAYARLSAGSAAA
jgi:hypothetical protein